MFRVLSAVALLIAVLPHSSFALGRPRVSEAGIRLVKDEIAYRLFVTENGEVFAATSTFGLPGMQWIRHRGTDGRWRVLLAKETTESPASPFTEFAHVAAFWHSGPRVDEEHPLWVAWQEPRVLALRTWDGRRWREHKRMSVRRGWFNGFAAGGGSLWVYGNLWHGEVSDGARDFAWRWSGSEWIETEGELEGDVSSGIEAMIVHSEDEAYALQNWMFRRWDGKTWRREKSPLEGISGVKVIDGHFVAATAMSGAFGSRIVAWNPREGEPKVISEHPLFASGETQPSVLDWIAGPSLTNLHLTSFVIRQTPNCHASDPIDAAIDCRKEELFRFHWDGTRWSRIESSPALAEFVRRGIGSQWPLADGSMWLGGRGYIDLVRP